MSRVKLILRTHKVIILAAALLIVARAALPFAINSWINWVLENKLEHYTGHLQDVDLSLYRGAYHLYGLNIRKKKFEGDDLVRVQKIDVSISWDALFHGKIRTNVNLNKVQICFTDDEKLEQVQFGTEEKNWTSTADLINPLHIDNFLIQDSEFRFVNRSAKPPVDIGAKNIEVKIENVNLAKHHSQVRSPFKITADVMKSAHLESSGTFDLIAKKKVLDGDLIFENLDLKELNPFLRKYASVDVTTGKFSLYAEAIIEKGSLKSYVKPYFEKLKIIKMPETISSTPKFFFVEVITAFTNFIFKNWNDKTVAAVVPIEGTLRNPQIKTWEAVKSSLGHAFKQDVRRGVDHSLSLK